MVSNYTQSPLTRESGKKNDTQSRNDLFTLTSIHSSVRSATKFEKSDIKSPIPSLSNETSILNALDKMVKKSAKKFISTPLSFISPSNNSELDEFMTPSEGFVTPCDKNPYSPYIEDNVDHQLGYSPIKTMNLETEENNIKSRNSYNFIKYSLIILSFIIPIFLLGSMIIIFASVISKIKIGEINLEKNQVVGINNLQFANLFSSYEIISNNNILLFQDKPKYLPTVQIIEGNEDKNLWLNVGSLVNKKDGNSYRIALEGEYINLDDIITVESVQYDWNDKFIQHCERACSISLKDIWIGNNNEITIVQVKGNVPISIRITTIAIISLLMISILIMTLSFTIIKMRKYFINKLRKSFNKLNVKV